MKKYIFMLVLCAVFLAGCGSETATTEVEAEFNAEQGIEEGNILGQAAGSAIRICDDTDGRDYFERGNLTYSYFSSDRNVTRGYVDYCRGNTSLVEYYCLSPSRPTRELITCGDYCFDGACVNVTIEMKDEINLTKNMSKNSSNSSIN